MAFRFATSCTSLTRTHISPFQYVRYYSQASASVQSSPTYIHHYNFSEEVLRSSKPVCILTSDRVYSQVEKAVRRTGGKVKLVYFDPQSCPQLDSFLRSHSTLPDSQSNNNQLIGWFKNQERIRFLLPLDETELNSAISTVAWFVNA